MERLTVRNKNGLADAVCCGENCEYNNICETGGTGECGGMYEIIDRLAAIEDILGDEYELDRVRELVKADREGRCVVMPIKVPGWGWCCNDKFPNAISAYFGCPSQVVDCMEDYILRGTKEQAEAALKAREQDEH